MNFSLRTLLILVAVVAVILPSVVFLIRANTQPPLCFSRSAKISSYALPYFNCVSVHEAPWGKPRIIILHKVSKKAFILDEQFPDWFADDGYLPVRINGRRVYAGESVIAIYAENGNPPKTRLIENDELPLGDPWWPDESDLWEMVNIAE